MTWDDLSKPWQAALSEAWTAYCAGSLPIGCAIADREDNILFTGRNRLHEDDPPHGLLAGNHLAHAEMNALAPLRKQSIDPKQCVLYTTMEPCPMCTGAIRMTHIGAVHYAARDPVAGSIGLLDATPFMRRGGITVTGPVQSQLETFSVALTIAAFLELHAGTDLPVRIMTSYQPHVPDAVHLGQLLHDTGSLKRLCDGGYPADVVFRDVLGEIKPTA